MINYDLTKIQTIIFDVDGVLSSDCVTLSPEGEPLRTANIKDGYAIHLAAMLGFRIAIITGGNTFGVEKRYKALGLVDVFMGAHHKIETYEFYKAKYGYTDEQVIYVGDDIPDLLIMKRVGCPCCPKDAAPEIKAISTYVSHCNGGEGVGRDIVEQVLRAKDMWANSAQAFGW